MASIKKSLAWSFGGRHLSQIITLISSMFLARLLTPEQIGIYSLCAAITAMATIFRDFGISEYIIQEKKLTKEKLQGAYALAIITGWLMAAVLFMAKAPIAEFYDEVGVSSILTVLSINFLILPFASPGFALLNREMAFDKIFMVQFPSALIQAVSTVIFAYLGHSYMSLAWGSLIGIIAQSLLIIWYRPKDSLLLPSVRHIQKVVKFGMVFSLAKTIDTIMNNAHEIIISYQLGFAQLGLFSRAAGLINLFYVNVTSAVTRVAAPSFATSFRESKHKLLNDYQKALCYFSVLAWPFFGFVAIEAHSIIYILFGEQWVAAAPIASVLAGSQLLASIVAMAPNALVAMGLVKKRLLISTIVTPIHLVGIAIAAYFDVIWVAAVWIITWLITLLLYNAYLSRELGLTYVKLVTVLKSSFSVALGAVLLSMLVHIAGSYLQLPQLVTFVFSGISLILSWWWLIFYLRHPIANELAQIKVWLIKKS